jgi:hypothetical protein
MTAQNTAKATWLIGDYEANQQWLLVCIYHNQMHDGVTYQRSMLIHNPILAKRYPTCLQLRYLNVSNYSYRFSFVLPALMCQGKVTGCFQNICSMVPGINTVIRRYLRHVHEMNEYRTDRVCLFVRIIQFKTAGRI